MPESTALDMIHEFPPKHRRAISHPRAEGGHLAQVTHYLCP